MCCPPSPTTPAPTALAFLGVFFLTLGALLVGGGVVAGAERESKTGTAQKGQTTQKAQKAQKATKAKARKPPPHDKTEVRSIDASEVWRESEVFSAEQLLKLEPILRTSTCKNEALGCTYLENGRPGSEARFEFRLIPWKVSRHRSYLVRNDRCAPGGCDQGLFVQIDGRWHLVAEMFGILERRTSATRGFNDLVAHPRGRDPVHLEWDGQTYREVGR